MMRKEKHNFFAISVILLTTTMLSNSFNEQLEEDAIKVIDFIGNAFKLDEKEIKKYKALIPDDLTILSTTGDVDAYFGNNGDAEYPLIRDFLYLKAEAILKILNIYNLFASSTFNQHYFDYKYLRPYFSDIRFKELELSSVKGNIEINRTVAIMLAIGIGCDQDVEAAIYRFKQCAYWGDISSLLYLSYLYELKGDKENSELFLNLTHFEKQIMEGRTLISKEDKEKYEEKTLQTFIIISSIKQDIVLSYNVSDIDYSFVEVMLMDNIDYYTKLDCINNYRSQQWKEITNPSINPNKTLGFKIKGGDK